MKYEGLKEKTVVIVKPDGVRRGLTGEVINRIERTGLKIIALKMVKVSREFAMSHYPGTEKWLKGLGNKTLKNYKEYNMDPIKEFGTDDPLKIGKQVYEWLGDYFSSGPVVAMIVQGNHAVDNVRMIAGDTLPVFALPGTIRGDFSMDSSALANAAGRSIKNVIHASGDPDEAKHEIEHWFAPEEVQEYKRVEEAEYLEPSLKPSQKSSSKGEK